LALSCAMPVRRSAALTACLLLSVPLLTTPALAASPPAPSIEVTAIGDQRLANKPAVTTATFSTTTSSVLLLAFVAGGDTAAGNTVVSVTAPD